MKVGDKVRFIAGGPDMVVTRMGWCRVECEWWGKDIVGNYVDFSSRDRFVKESLVRI